MLDLLRHGGTGREGYLDGGTDTLLSPDGWSQFAAQTDGRDWSMIVSSPLRRAREAAEKLAAERGMELRTDPDWAELNFGQWDGRARSEIESNANDREALAAFYREPAVYPPPSGEAWENFEARIARALAALVSSQPTTPVLVITHGGPIRLAISQACGLPLNRLWVLRIACATRIRLGLAAEPDGRLWGEIIEIAQP